VSGSQDFAVAIGYGLEDKEVAVALWDMAPVIRECRVGEELDLHEIFFSAVHALAPGQYSRAQIDAWAPVSFDKDRWIERVRDLRPFVVERGGEILAYADLQPSGYIDHFYVGGGHARQGVGTVLMDHIHRMAGFSRMGSLTSEVSLTAQPFFERFGFAVVERRQRGVGSVAIPYVFMRKALSGCSS
jgi:putative acetyltransferase